MMVTLRRMWLQLTADRRRFGALCIVSAIGLLLWARLIVISNMPRTAVADPNAPTAEGPISDDTSDNPIVAPVFIDLAEQPDRDPFAISERFFPRKVEGGQIRADEGKSTGEQTEDPEQAEIRLLARAQSIVDQLRLDAVMSSASLVVINGQTWRVGDRISMDGSHQVKFTIAEVSQRVVVLECEGHRFELKMSGPGG